MGTNSPGARGGPQPWHSSLKLPTYCDASFAPGGGRSRSGILVLLVDEVTNRASLLLWQSRRQTLTALSAPEAEVVALLEALMLQLVVIRESCCGIGLEVGQCPKILFVVKTDSQVTWDSAVLPYRNAWIGSTSVVLMPLLPATLRLTLRNRPTRRSDTAQGIALGNPREAGRKTGVPFVTPMLGRVSQGILTPSVGLTMSPDKGSLNFLGN